MSGFLYENYCYETIDDLANHYVNVSDRLAGSFLEFLTLTSVSGNSATFTINTKGFNTLTQGQPYGNFTRSFPTCPSVGADPVTGLQQMFDNYFLLDQTIFDTIITETLVAFALGLTVGVIIKLISKT